MDTCSVPLVCSDPEDDAVRGARTYLAAQRLQERQIAAKNMMILVTCRALGRHGHVIAEYAPV